MADKGFRIQHLLDPLGVELIIPPFLGDREQFTKEEVIYTQQIAHMRIHVERFMAVIKDFHFLDASIPVKLFGSINQIFTVICLLCNFQDPIIS